MTDITEVYRQMCEQATEIQKHDVNMGDVLIDHIGNKLTVLGCRHIGSYIFLPDIRWYIERIPKPYDISIEESGFLVSNLSHDESWYSILGDSLEIALLKVYMHTVHHKRRKEGKWVEV